ILFFLFVSAEVFPATSIDKTRADLEIKLQVKIVYDSVCIDSWKGVTYTYCNDTAVLHQYLQLLQTEYSKYPDGFFAKAGVNYLVLGRDLKYAGVIRAAVPDPYKHFLFLAVNGAYGDSSNVYRTHVMHHELNHCSETLFWSSGYYEWKEWGAINRVGFKYRGNGAQAYGNSHINWYGITHPLQGFVNYYSTSSQEEDRSELVALIMTDSERHFLEEFSATDVLIQKKLALIVDYLNKQSGTSVNFWTEKINWLPGK
ncbi:MAG: hypothetical protein IAF38_21520, partial [Bacteroidia bacterium]|nr:hypothetical protein [Bacteroidia bacterium]